MYSYYLFPIDMAIRLRPTSTGMFLLRTMGTRTNYFLLTSRLKHAVSSNYLSPTDMATRLRPRSTGMWLGRGVAHVGHPKLDARSASTHCAHMVWLHTEVHGSVPGRLQYTDKQIGHSKSRRLRTPLFSERTPNLLLGELPLLPPTAALKAKEEEEGPLPAAFTKLLLLLLVLL
jgi:hypothetical protein